LTRFGKKKGQEKADFWKKKWVENKKRRRIASFLQEKE